MLIQNFIHKNRSQISLAATVRLFRHLQQPQDPNLILIEHYSYNFPCRPPACVNDHLFIDLWLSLARFSRGLRFLLALCHPLACPWSESILKLRLLTSSRLNTRSLQMEKDIPISPAPFKELNCTTDLSGFWSALETLKLSLHLLSVICLHHWIYQRTQCSKPVMKARRSCEAIGQVNQNTNNYSSF